MDSAFGIDPVNTSDGKEYALHIHQRKDGPSIQIGEGYWEYAVKSLVTHPVTQGEKLCVDMGQNIHLSEGSTWRLYQLAREASGLSEDILDRIAQLWEIAQFVKARIYDGGKSYNETTGDHRWFVFHALCDEIDENYRIHDPLNQKG